MNMRDEICIYCGVRTADTRDHIPPKAILPKPHPDNLIVVPACHGCNNSFKVSDEEMRAYLTRLLLASNSPHVINLRKLTQRTFNKNYKLNRIFLGSISKVLPRGLIVKIDKDERLRHQRSIDRVIRALYFKAFKNTLTDDYVIEIFDIMKQQLPSMFDFMKSPSKKISIDDEIFYALYSEVVDIPGTSIWELYFYKTYVVRAVTYHKNFKSKIE